MLLILKKRQLYKRFISWRDERITRSLFDKEYGCYLRTLKNKHKGQRCFIIGNGPSLCAADLDLLRNEVTFASNYIFKMYEQTQWRPTYYCNSDLGVLQKLKDDPCFWNAESSYNFFQYNARFILNNHFPKDSMCFYLKETTCKRLPFSKNFDRIVYDSATVTYIILQLACYMGFSDIYLLGIDHNYSTTIDHKGTIKKQNLLDHFYSHHSNQDNDGGAVAFVERMEQGYISARRYARKHHINIYNATRGGKLEVFERKNLNSLF